MAQGRLHLCLLVQIFRKNPRKIYITLHDAVLYNSIFTGKKVQLGHNLWALLIGIAECTPDFLASYEHVLTTPLRSVGLNRITIHRAFPIKLGCSLTSTNAKKLSMSTCKTIRLSWLSVSKFEADINVRWFK